jgi:anti-sigma B factor antagonist
MELMPTEQLASSLRPRGPVLFSVSIRVTDGVTVVGVDGELDILTAPRLAAEIDSELRSGTNDLTVDLRQTRFFDSAGLHILLNAQRRLTRSSRAFCVVCPPGPVRRVFELAKLIDTLGVVESLSERRRTPRPLGLAG